VGLLLVALLVSSVRGDLAVDPTEKGVYEIRLRGGSADGNTANFATLARTSAKVEQSLANYGEPSVYSEGRVVKEV